MNLHVYIPFFFLPHAIDSASIMQGRQNKYPQVANRTFTVVQRCTSVSELKCEEYLCPTDTRSCH